MSPFSLAASFPKPTFLNSKKSASLEFFSQALQPRTSSNSSTNESRNSLQPRLKLRAPSQLPIAITLLIFFAHPAHHPRHFGFVLLHRLRIALPPLKFLFAFEFLPIHDTRFIHRSALNGSTHGTPWLTFMPTISKPAFTRQFLDVRKCLDQPSIDIP